MHEVVRVCLLALKNLLESAETAEEVVEAGALEAVESLEYEKWRDAEVPSGTGGAVTGVRPGPDRTGTVERIRPMVGSRTGYRSASECQT